MELKAKTESKVRPTAQRRSRRTVKRRIFTDLDGEDDNESSALAEVLETAENDGDESCIYCNKLYSRSKPGEHWLQCQLCFNWSHASCGGFSPRSLCVKSVKI